MWNSGTGTSATRQVKPPVAHPLGIETSCETADTAGANYLSRVYYFGASSYPEGGAYIGLWILIPHEGYRTEAHGGFPAVELPANEWVFVKTTEKVTGVALGIRIRTVDDSIVDPEHRGYLTGAVVSATPIDHFFDGSTVSDRAHDLWYNADGAPHEWVNGQGWTVLTDARLGQLAEDIVSAKDAAIAQAATDAQTKADKARADAEAAAKEHAQLVADGAEEDAIAEADRLHGIAVAAAEAAQTRANQAHTAAGTAQSTADSALTMAGSKSKVTYSTSAPAGTATVGDTHRQQNATGDIIGEWEYTADGWQKRQVSSDAISNLDVGKLTAGTTEIVEAVINKLWAELGVFGRLEAREGWVGGVNLADGAVTAEKIEATREMITKIFGAEWAYISEKLVVEGELIAANIDAISASIDGLTVTERAVFAKAFAQEMWAELGVFDKLQAEEAWVTSAMIKELTAEKVTVTQEFVARVASFAEIFADKLWANEAFIDRMVASEAYFGSEDADQQTRVDGQGVTSYRRDEQGELIPALQFGGGDLSINWYDESGAPTGSIGNEGDITGRIVQAQAYSLAGRPIFGDPENYGGEGAILDNLPRGEVAYGYRDMAGLSMNGRSWGFLEVTPFTAQAGRVYHINVSPFRMAEDRNWYLIAKYTLDGSSPDWRDNNTNAAPGGGGTELGGTIRFTPEEDGMCRMLIFVLSNAGGTNTVFANNNAYVHVSVTDEGTPAQGVGFTRCATITSHDPQPLVRDYITGWPLGWHQHYRDGILHNGYYGKNLLQGIVAGTEYATTIWGGYTTTTATVGGGAAELGRTIPQALSGGAQLHSGSIRVTGYSTPASSNGYLNMHWHTHQSAPATFPLTPYPGNFMGEQHVRNGQTAYWDLPQQALDAIQAGQPIGFSLHVRQNQSSRYFAALNTDNYHGPILTLKYTR